MDAATFWLAPDTVCVPPVPACVETDVPVALRLAVAEAVASTLGASVPTFWRRVARASRTLALALATSRLRETASSIRLVSVASPSDVHQSVSTGRWVGAFLSAFAHATGTATAGAL